MKYYMKQQYYDNSAKVRVYSSWAQGGRKYMEDEYSVVHYHCSDPVPQKDSGDASAAILRRSFLFVGVFDGHGGGAASRYTRDHLCRNIVRQRAFWSNDDKQVCLAIHRGFVRTQRAMLNEVVNWPKTTAGYPCTAGTTASVAFIMNGKYYTGHVGDSRIVLGRKDRYSNRWIACPVTRDHKPDSPREKIRIESAGGKVVNKSGVGRVVWMRPKMSDSRIMELIPFLAVARSLGDLWSWSAEEQRFVVSPEPDVHCFPIDSTDRCLIFGTDGLWNMVSNQTAVKLTQEFEENNTPYCLPTFEDGQVSHASHLVDQCLSRWSRTKFRADNITAVAVLFEGVDGKQQNELDMASDQYNQFSTHRKYSMFNDFFHLHEDESAAIEQDSDEDPRNGLVGTTVDGLDLDISSDTEWEVSSVLSNVIDSVSKLLLDDSTHHQEEEAQSTNSSLDDDNHTIHSTTTNGTSSSTETTTATTTTTTTFIDTNGNHNHCHFHELTDEQLASIPFDQSERHSLHMRFNSSCHNSVFTLDRHIIGALARWSEQDSVDDDEEEEDDDDDNDEHEHDNDNCHGQAFRPDSPESGSSGSGSLSPKYTVHFVTKDGFQCDIPIESFQSHLLTEMAEVFDPQSHELISAKLEGFLSTTKQQPNTKTSGVDTDDDAHNNSDEIEEKCELNIINSEIVTNGESTTTNNENDNEDFTLVTLSGETICRVELDDDDDNDDDISVKVNLNKVVSNKLVEQASKVNNFSNVDQILSQNGPLNDVSNDGTDRLHTLSNSTSSTKVVVDNNNTIIVDGSSSKKEDNDLATITLPFASVSNVDSSSSSSLSKLSSSFSCLSSLSSSSSSSSSSSYLSLPKFNFKRKYDLTELNGINVSTTTPYTMILPDDETATNGTTDATTTTTTITTTGIHHRKRFRNFDGENEDSNELDPPSPSLLTDHCYHIQQQQQQVDNNSCCVSTTMVSTPTGTAAAAATTTTALDGATV